MESTKDSSKSNLGSSSSTTNDDESRTTILSPGVVESRNYNSKKSQISDEIQAFIAGTDGNCASSPSSEFRTFFTIWMFLTRLPSPSWIDLHPGFLMRGMSYFPMVGSVLGIMCAIIFDCLEISFGLPATISAALSISFGLYVTGCFHEDGLADSADGLGGGWSRSQVLKIMTDSRVGTFGAAALSLFLFTKLQLLGTLGTSHWKSDFEHGGSYGAGPAIVVAQTLARLSAPYLIRTREYVAEVGPKSPFYLFMVESKHIVSWPRVLFATLYSFGLSSILYGQVFATVLIFAVFLTAHLAGNKGDYLLGGVMGDFLGATICICEIVVLVLIVAKDTIIKNLHVAMELYIYNFVSLYDNIQSPTIFHVIIVQPQTMLAIYNNNGSVRPIFHFILLMVVLKIWCNFVGPPDMYKREDEEKNEKGGREKRD